VKIKTVFISHKLSYLSQCRCHTLCWIWLLSCD